MKKKQVLVYEIIGNLIIKGLCALVFLSVFIWITYELLYSPVMWQSTFPIAVVDAFVAHTTFRLSKHYFPSTTNSKENKS